MKQFARIVAIAAIVLVIPSILHAEEYYSVQAGSLSDKARAQKLLSRLFGSGFDCKSESQDGKYKVICGNFTDISDVNAFRQKLRSKGYADAFAVVVRNGEESEAVSDEVYPGNSPPLSRNNVNKNVDTNYTPEEYYSVQVGSISDNARAQKLVSRLYGRGIECVTVSVGFKYSVICGKLATISDARAFRQKLHSMGYADAFAVHVLNGGLIKDVSHGVDPEDKLTGALAAVEAEGGEDEYYSVQVGSLGDRKKAEKLVSRLLSSDLECAPVGLGGQYKVICGRFGTVENAVLLKQKLISKGYADAFTIKVKGLGGVEDDFVNVNRNRNLISEPLPEATPAGTPLTKKSKIWGREGGHFHPYVSASSVYTDNLYSVNEKRGTPEEDNITVTSVGLWLSFPSVKKPIRTISTIGHVPGGLRGVEITPYQEGKRLAFFSYRVENRSFSKHEQEDGISHNARGYLGYNFARGHRVVLDDAYKLSRSLIGNVVAGTGFINSPGEFTSNRLRIRGSLKLSEKVSVALQRVMFGLDYKDIGKYVWNRQDTIDSLGLSVGLTSKTKFSIGYSKKEVDYELDSRVDRKQTGYSFGLNWDVTGKTTGKIKAGTSTTEFDNITTYTGNKRMVYGAAISYRPSSKTSLSVNYSKDWSESDNIGSHFFIHDAMGFSLNWAALPKVKIGTNINRAVNSYYSVTSGGTDRLDREDVRLAGFIRGVYVFNRHVAMELGTTYASRVSSNDIYDFVTRGMYAGIAASF